MRAAGQPTYKSKSAPGGNSFTRSLRDYNNTNNRGVKQAPKTKDVYDTETRKADLQAYLAALKAQIESK